MVEIDKIGVEIGGEAVTISSESGIIRTLFDRHERFSRAMPGYRLVEPDLPGSRLDFTSGKPEYVITGENSVSFQAPYDSVSGEVLSYACYPLTEAARQRKGRLTSHAATVEIGRQGIVIFGKEGAGKSSLAIELCRHAEARLIGNDLSIIGMDENGFPAVFDGTKIVYLRKESVSRNLPDLLPLFSGSDLDTWRHKQYVAPESLGIESTRGNIQLKLALVVHVDQGQEKLFVKDDSHDFVTKLVLNENFSRHIRATANPGMGSNGEFMYYMPSFDCPELYEIRQLFMSRLLAEGLLYVSGRIDDIVKFVQSSVSKL